MCEALPPPKRPEIELPGSRPAAVLIALFEEAGQARVILTKRPDTMPTHQGEIAFPGGKLDTAVDEDLAAAALREAHEEIGLAPELVEIVAELDHLFTVQARFTLAPFVGLLEGRPSLHPDQREVVRVFDIALVGVARRRRVPSGAVGHRRRDPGHRPRPRPSDRLL